jgi:hypothetical protein
MYTFFFLMVFFLGLGKNNTLFEKENLQQKNSKENFSLFKSLSFVPEIQSYLQVIGNHWNSTFEDFTTFNQDCFIEYAGNLSNGIGNLQTSMVANDFMVDANSTFALKKVKLRIFGNISTGSIYFYQDGGDMPGQYINHFTNLIPTEQNFVEEAFGYNVYEVTFNLPTVQNFTAGASNTKFWIGLTTTVGSENVINYWEVSTTTNYSLAYSSADTGASWNITGNDCAFKLIEEGCDEPSTNCNINYDGSLANGFGPINSRTYADDFAVPANTKMTVNQVSLKIFRNISMASLYFYHNNDSTPSTVIGSFTDITPSSQTFLGQIGSDKIYEVVFDLPTPVELEAESTETLFWFGIRTAVGSEGGSNYVEVADTPRYSLAKNSPNGTSWTASSYNMAFKLFADCEEIVAELGCLANGFGQFPSYDYDPICNNTPNRIGNTYYGTYSIVNVTEGVEYTFSTSDSNAFITIGNDVGTTVLAVGTGSVSWTADATQQIRFYTHNDSNCNGSGTAVERYVQCDGNLPTFDCEFGNPLDTNFEGGYYLNNGNNLADEFIVEQGKKLTVQQVKLNVWSEYPIVGNATLNFRKNNTNNLPGEIIESVSVAATSSHILGTSSIYYIYQLTYDIAESIELTEGKYWLHPILNNSVNSYVFWDTTSTTYPGDFLHQSTDGINWYLTYGWNAEFFIGGVCEDYEVEPIEINVPNFPCFQGDGLASNNFEAGYYAYGGNNRTADDFQVPTGETFSVQQIRMNVFSHYNVTNAVLDFAIDNAGVPGNIESSITMSPTSSRIIGNSYGYDIHELTFDLATPIEFTEGTYWLIPTLTNTVSSEIYWEVTSTGTHGGYAKVSYDGGIIWYENGGGFQSVFFISGECEEVEEPTEGCLNTPNGQYPYTNFTPSCNGTAEIITDEGYYGEYSSVNVTAGTEYIFSTDDSNAYITLSDSNGTVVLAYGTGSVTWTATATTTIRFIVHVNDQCASSEDFNVRMVQCGEAIQQPENDDCANAIAVSCGDTVTGSTTSATNSGGNTAPDVFYTFTGNGTAQSVTLSLCNSSYDTYLRVFSDCTLTNEIAYNDDGCGNGTSLLTFQSDGTSTYYIMIEGYSSNSGDFELQVICQDPIIITEPDFPCFQGDGLSSNDFQDGYDVYGGSYRTADDFQVPTGETFTVQQIRMNVFSDYNVINAVFEFASDNGGVPGNVETNISMAPTSSRIIGSQYGFDIHELTFDLTTPIEFTEGTYWLIPSLTNAGNDYIYWEVTSTGSHGAYAKSSNNGGSWADIWGGGYQMVFFISGVCEEDIQPEDPGCLDTPNGQYPSGSFTPSCNGSTEVITDEGWFGEFSMVNVTEGTEYIFSTDVSTAFITIANASGDTVITSGTGSVTWTATMSGQVRFITHENDDCLSSSNWVERYIQCGEPYVFDDPDYACFQGDGSISAVEDGFGIEATDIYRVADDFTVEPGTEFTLRQVTMSLLSATGVTSATFRIHADNAGLPGAEMHNFTLTPSYNEIYGTAFGFNQHRVEFELSTPITLGEGTYWLSVTTPNLTYWIMTSSGTSGSLTANSNNSGTSWSLNTYGYRAVFYVEGDCDEVVEEPVEGCLDTPNGQYPSTAYTPSCNGTTEVITDLGWFGEFSMVNVTAGTEYIFSTDVATAFITIANAAGDTAIAVGTGSVTWTATSTGQVRFITHENDDCLSSSNWVERYVQCGEIVPPPPYDPCAPIHEGIATNGVGFVNNGTDNYMAANDFNVLMNTQFEVEKFTINVVTLGEEPTTFDLKFFEGDTAVGAQFGETLTNVTPSAITPNGTFGTTGYPVYSVEITLPNSIIFPATATADKKYWVGMSGMPTASGNPVYWVSSDYLYTDTLPTWQSADGGTTWAVFSPSVEGDMIIDGECATLGLGDIADAKFAYYPNPVIDVLNITSSKEIEKVEIFNLAGQKLMDETKVVNGQVNVKTLTPATYVFRVTLVNGAVETFKVIKKL